ncbi:MAG: glutathione S-transferase [Paraglaciecola psychrophila]|jgi:glutathione S-transferase
MTSSEAPAENTHSGSDHYTLYGMELSLYTGKIRSYLRYKQIPFDEVLATRDVYKSVILPNVGKAIVPVVATPDGQYVQDSSDIIDLLEQRVPARPVYPSSPKQRLAALLLEQMADEWLIIPAMHYRWNFPDYNQAYLEKEFGAGSKPELDEAGQRAQGRHTGSLFKGSVPMLGATPEMFPAIESWYEQLLDQLNSHFSRHRFLLGDAPTLADFGFIGPLYAHLGRDPYPMLQMQSRAPHVYQWVSRMRLLDELSFGPLLPEDTISPEIEAILGRMFKEQFPVLQDLANQLDHWATDNPDTAIPRAIGMHTFRIGDSEGERMLSPFNQWMVQRPLDYYHQLNGSARANTEAWLADIGGEDAMNMVIKRPLIRVNNNLQFA